MINNSISAKHLIWRVGRTFNIQNSDWITDSYEFIYNGLRELNIYQSLEPCHIPTTVTDYRFSLPCDLRILQGVTYNGARLKMLKSINKYYIKDLEKYPVSEHTMQSIPNGTIEVSFETGEVVVHYLKLPSEYDTELEVDVPLVPDNEYVLDALSWYLLYHILLRGYKHPSITWEQALEMWENKKWSARNRSTSLNPEEREYHRLVWSSMLINKDAWSNSFYRHIGN